MTSPAIPSGSNYGGQLDIRRRSLKQPVVVQRVRLVYEGGILAPKDPKDMRAAVNEVRAKVKGVEVLVQ